MIPRTPMLRFAWMAALPLLLLAAGCGGDNGGASKDAPTVTNSAGQKMQAAPPMPQGGAGMPGNPGAPAMQGRPGM